MSEERKSTIFNNWSSGLAAAGTICLFILGLYLKAELSGTVSVVDFEAYKRDQLSVQQSVEKTLAGVETSLAVLTQKMENDARQETRLVSLEDRVRTIEMAPRR